ncbi:hypothetical protein [Chroococcidiopsis sp. CCMEE 29]|nr:hypothetical protein [Chroococcidiopsis sp. CCMEE 29]
MTLESPTVHGGEYVKRLALHLVVSQKRERLITTGRQYAAERFLFNSA